MNPIPLQTPAELRDAHEIYASVPSQLVQHRKEIDAILNGSDSRKLAIIGPCGLDDSGAVHEFIERVSDQTKNLNHSIKIVYRMPPLKPRTTIGWRGLESESLLEAHSTLVKVANGGHAIAIELLSPSQGTYYADLLAMQWIGARNVTDQNVRLQASTMPEIPTLVKNGMFGEVTSSAQAMVAINSPHKHVTILGDDGMIQTVHTDGGNAAGIILRGEQDHSGVQVHNITPEAVQRALHAMSKNSISGYGVVVDASHSNGAAFSGGSKSASGQTKAAEATIELMKHPDVGLSVRGLMMECYVHEGTIKDAPTSETYGYSRSDPTLDIDDTIMLLNELAQVDRG